MRPGRSSVLLRTFLEVWRADRWGTIVAAALQAVGAVSAVGLVLVTKLALEAVLTAPSNGSGISRRLVLALVLLAVIVTLSSSVAVVQRLQSRVLGERVSQRMWSGVLRTTSGGDLVRWEDSTFLDRLDRVRYHALDRPTSVITSLLGLGGSAVSLVALVVALASLHWLLVPLLLVSALPVLALNRWASRLEFGFSVRTSVVFRRRQYLKNILTSRANAAEVRAFQAGGPLSERHAAEDTDYLRALVPHIRKRQLLGLASTAVSATGLALTLVVVVVLVRRGALSLGEAGAAAIAARLLGTQMSTALGFSSTLSESVPFIEDMESFVSGAADRPVRGRARALRRAVELDRVSFAYPEHDPVLHDVSLCLEQGQVVALVGANGSGKTTLAKLIAGLYAPSAGSVSWDGAPIAPIDLTASVAVLFQDFVRYQMTAEDNIAIADLTGGERPDGVVAAAQAADIDEAISALPGGYRTVLGQELEAGTDLSGGQWQRVALARALYRDSALVVLDEPTAAMDPQAEAALFGDVRAMLRGRTALMISHRFSSVRSADHIYVLDAGSIIESGTHEDLMARGGTYAEMFSVQAAGYVD